MTTDDLEAYKRLYERADWLIAKGYSQLTHEQLIKLLMRLEKTKSA